MSEYHDKLAAWQKNEANRAEAMRINEEAAAAEQAEKGIVTRQIQEMQDKRNRSDPRNDYHP